VLVGADVASTYCYLLSLEEHRDGDTWGIRLLELQDQGFDPEATIADAGKGLRAGQALAMPTVPCRGDVFHALQDAQALLTFLENRAYAAIGVTLDLERKKARLRCRGQRTQGAALKLGRAKREEAQSVAAATDVAALVRWLREDVLALAGPDSTTRRELFEFIVAELAEQTVRASSVIENLNSRLRSYFFLRRHLGPDYLALLQFFLNHRRFLRSERPERVGKSPAELLTGTAHSHWPEMLGYRRFSRP
jgi:hypothetical protein